MLQMINQFLMWGTSSSQEPSLWPLAIATALTAAMILSRQHED